MKHKHFIQKLHDKSIIDAIKLAESKTTGQIRVFVAKRAALDPVAAAEKHFKALGMTKTRDRNAVLIFVAPKSRTFAVFGDRAVHERCGDSFWATLRDEMATHLKESRYTDAIVHVVERAGELLAKHFPSGKGDNPNEQPDEIIRG
jgi:uncharacterized membrane protein